MTQLIDLGKLRFHFAGDYNNSTVYESNDIVKYGGNVYVYTYGLKTSGHLPTDTTYWALMVEGIKFKGVYDNAYAYKVGDAVAHGGKVYIAVIDTTAHTPPNTTYWSQFADGIQYEGVYSNVGQYQKNDIVSYGSSGYIALQDTTGNVPTNTTYWAKLIEGVSASGAWNSATAYVPNDIVAYGANQYKSIANNTNQVPINAAGVLNSNWILMTEGIRARGEWVTATEYYINDVVQHGGNSYICLLRNAATTFDADLAANRWAKFNGGIRWRGAWSASTAYLKDDVVKDGVGSAYIANLDHTSGSVFDTDRTASKWTQFVIGGSDVLPAIQATDTGQSLTVKADGATIDWIGATQSDKVFYVAPHGTDVATAGKNMSTPFASIKYATQQCGEGATIFVKTGTYSEQLPITIPANTAIVGDNQRTTIVQPATGNSDDGVTPNAQSSMFLMSNGSILNKMTFKGMTGWQPGLTASDVTTSIIKGVVVRLNPDSPITHKSPYVLECAFIGSGAIGALIDGSVHSTGAKTMIFHGYTVISDNGVGYWVKDGGKAEIVSCFTYYAYFGYTASGGGFIRALNGNNSYGTWGATARGFDSGETPITGAIVGEQLPFVYTGGLINAGDTVSNGAGATATVTNVQYSANKVYIKDRTGTFSASQTLTFSSGGTGTCSSGAESQRGFVLVASGFSALPKPGASISLAGDTYSYVIQSVTNTWVDSTSDLVLLLSQEKPSGSAAGTGVTIRYKYSQIRLTGHDFLSIGTGGVTTTNYPGTPTQPAAQGNETDEAFPGRVFYVSTDQDGNFRVGEYFRIDQATGRATLNASAFDLSGLSSLRLGSIGAQLGEQINEFSSDATMSGNSNTAVPTEYAVRTYVNSTVSSSLPSQTGNSGKLLGTNGSTVAWVEGLPVQTDKSGYYLRSNGTSSFWDSMTQISGPTTFGVQTGQAFPNTTYSASSLVTASPTWTWSLIGAPSNLSINSSGVLSQSSNFASGTYSFKVQATDGKFAAQLSVTIAVDVNMPVFGSASPPTLVSPNSGALSFTFAQATTPTGSPTHTLAAGSALPSWATLNSDGTITGTAPTTALAQTSYGFTVIATRNGISASKTFVWTLRVDYPVGQQLFGTNVGAGTFSWTAPAGVTTVAAVCIGGGHGGSSQWSYGGGAGGGLGYKNNITVVPGQTYTVVVGSYGGKYSAANYYNSSYGYSGFEGGDSYFINTSTVAGQGGGRPSDGVFNGTRYIPSDYGYSGGGYVGDGGGRGGNVSSSWTTSGAGAGGYYGRGGCIDSGWSSSYGGALGDYYSSTYGTGGGGGVGLLGDDGSDRYGIYCYTPWTSYYSRNGSNGGGGGHGPGGNNGSVGENQWSSPWPYGYSDIRGGDYGGGGGGSGSSNGGGRGGQGGVRIIWGTINGSVRAFPNTYAADQTPIS